MLHSSHEMEGSSQHTVTTGVKPVTCLLPSQALTPRDARLATSLKQRLAASAPDWAAELADMLAADAKADIEALPKAALAEALLAELQAAFAPT